MKPKTEIGNSKYPVGYCRHHKATLSARQLKNKQCLGKNCHHLEKYKTHPFWKARVKKNREKKQKKLNNSITVIPSGYVPPDKIIDTFFSKSNVVNLPKDKNLIVYLVNITIHNHLGTFNTYWTFTKIENANRAFKRLVKKYTNNDDYNEYEKLYINNRCVEFYKDIFDHNDNILISLNTLYAKENWAL